MSDQALCPVHEDCGMTFFECAMRRCWPPDIPWCDGHWRPRHQCAELAEAGCSVDRGEP